MSGPGFIHDSLELKILILYIMRRLPSEVSKDMLADLVLLDEGISYFDFSDCLSDLLRTEHVFAEGEYYSLTEKGRRNGEIAETGIPYSVRLKAQRAAAAASRELQRKNLVKTHSLPRENGGFAVRLSLDDGVGQILSLEILSATENQAAAMEKNFSRRAERIFESIVSILENAE